MFFIPSREKRRYFKISSFLTIYWCNVVGSNVVLLDECWTDEDCNYHGQCIDTRATTPPVLQCYCERGWFGAECDKGTYTV